MRDLSKELHHLRNFENLVYDAVHLLYLAHDIDRENDNDGYEYSFVRSSILNTVLLFECAANCCIDVLNLSSSFQEDIDKLPFLSKYEFFLKRINQDVAFDRGCKEVQAVAELKAVRDSYVHPKVKKQRYVKIDQDIWSADFGQTNLLKIPRNPEEWGRSHAVKALKTANDFFNHYFLLWCKFNTDTVCEVLLGSDPASIPATSNNAIDCIGGLDRAALDWDINFMFLGKKVV